MQCVRLLRKFRPHVVIGVGGYASGPVMGAAILTAGFRRWRLSRMRCRAWRIGWSARRVKAAAVNFEPAARYFRNAHVTGIPVRAEFFRLAPRPAGARRICWFSAEARERGC